MFKIFIALVVMVSADAWAQEATPPAVSPKSCERAYKEMAFAMAKVGPKLRWLGGASVAAGAFGSLKFYRAIQAVGPLGREVIPLGVTSAILAGEAVGSSFFSYAFALQGPIYRILAQAITDAREDRIGAGIEALTALVNAKIYKASLPRELTFSAIAKLGKARRRDLQESLNQAPLAAERILNVIRDMMATQELCKSDGSILDIEDFARRIFSRLWDQLRSSTAPPTAVVSPAR